MQKIHVNLKDGGYDVLIGSGLMKKCGELAAEVTEPCKAFIISDTNVAPLYLEKVEKSFESAGFSAAPYIFEAGEKSKTISTVVDMIEKAAGHGLSRTDCVAALGGGVTGDMAGFAAAMYMRGINFIQISTSLLSDIDSSVGGKTGCDLKNGKNLAGAFHQPKIVIIDTDALKTLPRRFINDGMGEMIKYGVIRSKTLFNSVFENPENAVSDENICECVSIKREVVEADEFEHGERKLLNFGHTLGHAIEKYYDYEKYSHGEAVTIGMIMMTRAAEKNGLCEPGTAEKIRLCAGKFGLPAKCDANVGELVKIAVNDKKRRGGKIDVVLPKKIGSAFVYTLSFSELTGFLS